MHPILKFSLIVIGGSLFSSGVCLAFLQLIMRMQRPATPASLQRDPDIHPRQSRRHSRLSPMLVEIDGKKLAIHIDVEDLTSQQVS